MLLRRAALLSLLGTLAFSAPARATVVERIVATVGERAVLLSDLRSRAEPFLLQIQQTVPAGAQRNAAISQVYKAVLEKIVDEELLERAAIQAKVTITAREVDEALGRVAAQNKLTVEQVVAEAERAGLSQAKYREELRRQLLEAKLLNVRLQGRIRITEDDLRAAYRKLEVEERGQLPVQLAWIVIRGNRHPGEKARELAEAAAADVRREDFATVARRVSEDAASRDGGGALAKVKASELPGELLRASMPLDVGQSSPAFRVGSDWVVIKVLARDESSLPEYEEARRELSERVYMDKMGQARRSWLDSLRRQQHVEVRL